MKPSEKVEDVFNIEDKNKIDWVYFMDWIDKHLITKAQYEKELLEEARKSDFIIKDIKKELKKEKEFWKKCLLVKTKENQKLKKQVEYLIKSKEKIYKEMLKKAEELEEKDKKVIEIIDSVKNWNEDCPFKIELKQKLKEKP